MACQIVGGQSIVLPQLHGKHTVDHMAGAEEQHIIFPVIPQKGAVLPGAVRNRQGPSQKAQAGEYHSQQHQNAD